MKARVPLKRKRAIRESQLMDKMRGRSLGALDNRMLFDIAALILGHTGSPRYQGIFVKEEFAVELKMK